MKKRYLVLMMAAFMSGAVLLYGCDKSAKSEEKEEAENTVDISSGEETDEEASAESTEGDETVETAKEADYTATEEAVVEDGWTADSIYDLHYAVPDYYNLLIDDISDHSETGSVYEKAYDYGPESADGEVGVYLCAYEKNAGITEESGYSSAEDLVKSFEEGGLEFEEYNIPSLSAKVYRAKTDINDSFVRYKTYYIFEKSADDPYIYELEFSDRYDESALHISFKKSLGF